MIWKMAYRNIWKNKRRTLITLASISFGVLLSITFTGIGDSSYSKMINGAARLGSGHVSILPRGYLDAPSLGKTIHIQPTLMNRIRNRKHITACVPRIVGQVMAATPKDSVGAMFIALDPSRESSKTSHILDCIKKGRIFSENSKTGVLIGVKMAARLKARIGSKVIYTATDKHGEIVSALSRVSGIFQTGANQSDAYMIILPLHRVAKLLGYEPGEYTELAIFVDDQHYSRWIRDSIRKMITSPEMEVLTWRKTMSEFAGWVTLDSTMNYLFQVIIFLMVAAGILNTILMSVLERSREFGIMLAIGMSPGRLVRMIFAESVWLGLFGIIAGLVITFPVYYTMHTHGLDLSSWMTETTDIAGVIFDPVIYNELRLKSLIIILSGAFTVTVLAGIYPAWKAGRIPPVEAIKSI